MAKIVGLSALRRKSLWIPLAVLIFAWGLLYLPHLRTSPRWYGDETLTLSIGKSLFVNQPADRSLKVTFWHPSYSYQPGYAWVVGGMAYLTGGDILGARFINVALALAIALLLFLYGRQIIGHVPAFFAAFLFLAYQQSVIHFRWIYPHNSVALAFAVIVLCLLRKSRPRPDWIAGAGLALAAASHPLFAHGAIATWLCRIKRPSSWLRLAIPPAIVMGASLGFALWRYWPENWLPQDLSELLGFYRTSSAESGSGFQAFTNLRFFFTHDFFHIGALFGCMLCLTRKRLYPIALFGFVVAGILLQNRQNIPLFYYQAVTLLPVWCLAWGGGLYVIFRWLRAHVSNQQLVRFGSFASLSIPLLLLLFLLPTVFAGKLVSRNDFWVTQNPGEVEQAAKWLNENTTPSDLVICGPNISWLLHAKAADFIQATAWSGKKTFTFEQKVPHSRFLFPADFRASKFLVVGDIEQRWTFAQPNVDAIGEALMDEKWPIVWRGPNYVILENPNWSKSTSSPN